VSQRAIAFRPLQGIHDNIYTANISVINPLSPVNFVVMHSNSKEVVVRQGELIYDMMLENAPNAIIIKSL